MGLSRIGAPPKQKLRRLEVVYLQVGSRKHNEGIGECAEGKKARKGWADQQGVTQLEFSTTTDT